MSPVERPSPWRLEPALDRALVRPVASLEEVRAALDPELTWWGYVARPDGIRFLHRSGDEWQNALAEPGLVEARIFHPGADLRWLHDRGVVLEETSEEDLDADLQPDVLRLGGDGWWARDRRSRLWGEYLEDTETWYEESIPDPVRYEGIAPGHHHRYVFLHYREYVRHGAVRFVRFLRLQGGA